MFDREKMRFGIPLGEWLRGPLRDWGENLLDAGRMTQEGWLKPQAVRQKWDEHVSGKSDWQYLLWNVLMFQLWLQESTTPKTAAHTPQQAL